MTTERNIEYSKHDKPIFIDEIYRAIDKGVSFNGSLQNYLLIVKHLFAPVLLRLFIFMYDMVFILNSGQMVSLSPSQRREILMIDPSWGVTKAVVCIILSVGWC